MREGVVEDAEDAMKDPLKPDVALLMKIGSIAVHADEMIGPGGHEFDKHAIESLLEDKDVKQWIKDMGVYLPRKRSDG